MTLEPLLRAVAIAQLLVAVLNLRLVRLMGWKEDLQKLPLLVREVFHVHCWFISVTLAIFAVMTWRFAAEMAAQSDPAAVWLACAIAVFWGLRTVLQAAYYSSSHWRGKWDKTIAHMALLLIYGAMSVVYLFSQF